MQIVPQKPAANAVAVAEALPFIRYPVAVGIAQTPQMRDVCQVNILATSEDAGCDSVKDLIEPFGIDHRSVRLA